MDWIVFLWSYVEALTPTVTVCRDRACEEVLRVNWGHKGGVLIWKGWYPWKKRKCTGSLSIHAPQRKSHVDVSKIPYQDTDQWAPWFRTSMYGFYYVEVVSIYSSLLSVFTIKGCWDFVKCFIYISLDDHMDFFLHSVHASYSSDWFSYIELLFLAF